MARRLRPIDGFVLLLAFVSAGLVVVATYVDPADPRMHALQVAELACIVLFAFEFLLELIRHDRRIAYAVRNWYEVLALIPMTSQPIQNLEWAAFIPLAAVVLMARFGRVIDRVYGDEVFYRFVDRAKSAAVESIADAVTVRVLDQTLAVLQKGDYTANLAAALEEHGDAMVALAVEKVKADPEVGTVRHLPFFDTAVSTSAKVTQRILIDLLRDPRMDAMVKDIIADNVKQIRAEVAKRDARLTARLAT